MTEKDSVMAKLKKKKSGSFRKGRKREGAIKEREVRVNERVNARMSEKRGGERTGE